MRTIQPKMHRISVRKGHGAGGHQWDAYHKPQRRCQFTTLPIPQTNPWLLQCASKWNSNPSEWKYNSSSSRWTSFHSHAAIHGRGAWRTICSSRPGGHWGAIYYSRLRVRRKAAHLTIERMKMAGLWREVDGSKCTSDRKRVVDQRSNLVPSGETDSAKEQNVPQAPVG